MDEPFDPHEAHRRFKRIIQTGTIVFTRHCHIELERDDRSTQDCINALRGGAVQQPEWEKGAWRYRVETGRVTVVVEFADEETVVVVSAWRTAR